MALTSGEAELVAALSGACEGMGLRQQWKWSLKLGCSAEETNATTQQILCCASLCGGGYGTAQGLGSKDETHRVESVLLATVERATRSKTCQSGDQRDACRLSDEDTFGTMFDSPLETLIGHQMQS